MEPGAENDPDRRRDERRRAARTAARRRRRLAFAAIALAAIAVGAAAGALVTRDHAEPEAVATTTKPVTHAVSTRPRPVSVAATRTVRTTTAAAATTTAPAKTAPRPRIVSKPVPFDASRRAQMAAYELKHYGRDTWRLTSPKVIVEHYTASNSFSSAWNTFASNAPDGELGELPGTCAHFVIDTDGTIYQLVPLTTACRHTVGLNWTAIGIEHVGTSDQAILGNRRQLDASLALTAWLMAKYGIQLRNVIGHSESVTSPYHDELYAPWRCQTHGDWSHADMELYRADLRRIAVRDGIPIGPSARPAESGC